MKTKRAPDKFNLPSFRRTLPPTVQGKFTKEVESMADMIVDEIFGEAGRFASPSAGASQALPWGRVNRTPLTEEKSHNREGKS